ncbi:MAG: chemotaxis protein CheA [Thioploca sp.]|nr:chemotaxis protein CheA [Thioploca sp.]
MTSEDCCQEAFITEFIDDLYAECDERLSLVRRDLLALESFVQQPALDQNLLDALLRNLHTIKGLCGTINLKVAEQLAHQLENYLRSLRQGQIKLSHDGLEILFTGVQLLEQSIIAHRTNNSLPDITVVSMVLTQVVGGTASTTPPTTTSSALSPSSEAEPPRIWRFEFIPTPTLVERGINVNQIRSRLEGIGKITQATPRPTAQGGGLAFEFLVATSVAEATFAAWQADGLTYTLSEPPPPPSSPEPLASPQPAEPHLANHDKSPPLSATTRLPALTPSNMVRVDMTRIDELMRLIGELVTTRARQDNHLKQLRTILPIAPWRILQETNLALERHLRALREAVMRVRLVPIGTAFERMQFVIRDLMHQTHKAVKLELTGKETEIDKMMVDKMIDPLLHLVRNAVSHGIESPTERLAQGKLAEGVIALRAYNTGDMMTIEIEDDGHGIDPNKVAQHAHNQGLLAADTVLDPTNLLELLCRPGFTTQAQADLASGRGVGMDVVRNAVIELGGTISLTTQVGKGTCFTIQLPLTLSIADALIISVSGQLFAVPQVAVHEVARLNPAAITVLENNEILLHPRGILPLLYLNRLFHLTEPKVNQTSYVLVVGGSSAATAVAMIVDRIVGEQEIVVRTLTDPLAQVPGIVGASELGDGKIGLILDVVTLTRMAYQTRPN